MTLHANASDLVKRLRQQSWCGPLHIEAADEIERLRAALRIFIGCAYPVAKEINPRGHAWRPEESLDYALSEATKALGGGEQSARYGPKKE